MKRKLGIVFLCGLFLLGALATGVVSADGPLAIDLYAIGGGGGPVAQGTFLLDASIGQSLAGNYSAAPYQVCFGFWCVSFPEFRSHLPFIRRQ